MIISGITVVHLLLILLPPVNFEFAFVDAARYFSSHDQVLLDQYFTYQANTLGMPYLAWILSEILPAMNMLSVIRLLSVAGIVLFGYGILNICRHMGRQDNAIILLLILLNPLVWIFSARGTADFLPAAVGVFAISLALGANPTRLRTLVSGILLGFAAILKYHALCLSVFLIALLWSRRQERWVLLSSFAVIAIAIAAVAAYMITAHAHFGFWVTPPKFQSVHHVAMAGIISNFISYAGFLVILSGPLSLVVPEARQYLVKFWKFLLPVLIFLFLAGMSMLQTNGEMNFGPLDRWISKRMASGIFLLLGLGLLSPILLQFSERDQTGKLKKCLGLAVILTLLVFSLSRPAQRYLLLVLPFFVLALPIGAFRLRSIFIGTIALYIAINAFISYSQWCTGTAAEQMAAAIERAGLLEASKAGAIKAHVGNRFYQAKPKNLLYVVVPGNNPRAIITSKSGLSFAQTSFSLVSIAKDGNPVKIDAPE
ncbi:hypothetical protein [Methylomicrobium lacus]|uniref:hypothetical protein n=1 Tax=Methylomicrobium lacus TaxID=136992 RepID=UPI0035A8C3F1